MNDKKISRIDYGQLFIVSLLGFIGLAAIYSAQQNSVYDTNFFKKQVLFFIVGFFIAFVVMQFDSDQLLRASWYLYWAGVSSLVLLIVAPESLAPEKNGAHLWFDLGPVSIQPSEFMKIFLIIALAAVIHRHHLRYEVKTIQTDLNLLGKLLLFTAIPLLLVIREDLGTSLVLMAIFAGMVLVSGITWRLLLPLFSTVFLLIGGILYLVMQHPEVIEKYTNVEQYQLERIYSWRDPYNTPSNSSYQLIKSIEAIGSGEVSGKGFQNKEVFIPEAHSDFIFAIIGEEFGFLGGSFVIMLYFSLIFTWTRIALETTIDFNSYICAGVISMFTFHVFQNIGMCIGLMPITGIPLPFLSYGGSSLWGSMMALGLIFSIRYHHKVYMFSSL